MTMTEDRPLNDTIYWHLTSGDPKRVVQALDAVADFLRQVRRELNPPVSPTEFWIEGVPVYTADFAPGGLGRAALRNRMAAMIGRAGTDPLRLALDEFFGAFEAWSDCVDDTRPSLLTGRVTLDQLFEPSPKELLRQKVNEAARRLHAIRQQEVDGEGKELHHPQDAAGGRPAAPAAEVPAQVRDATKRRGG